MGRKEKSEKEAAKQKQSIRWLVGLDGFTDHSLLTRDGGELVFFLVRPSNLSVFIHPFLDGNGRVARLLMNMALIQDGYLPAVIPPVLRMDYISLLERAHREDHDFVEFIAERVLESQKEILRLFQIPFPKLEQGSAGLDLG